ncbi:protein of unknown function [Methylacidimicrobium sp. AP8]|nr:protein of unknown function [Methylacidimicrobium sp. AP8]
MGAGRRKKDPRADREGRRIGEKRELRAKDRREGEPAGEETVSGAWRRLRPKRFGREGR